MEKALIGKRAVGDAAAMREALEKMRDLFERGVICTSYANTPEEMEQIEELYREAKAALASPRLNCEVGTAEEQAQRFKVFCDKNKDPEAECLNCPLLGLTGGHCELAWAQMPYKEGGE